MSNWVPSYQHIKHVVDNHDHLRIALVWQTDLTESRRNNSPGCPEVAKVFAHPHLPIPISCVLRFLFALAT